MISSRTVYVLDFLHTIKGNVQILKILSEPYYLFFRKHTISNTSKVSRYTNLISLTSRIS